MTAALYYVDEYVTLYHGDALDILPTLPASSARLTVTDPPYVIGAVSAGNMTSKAGGWGDMMNSAHWFAAWYREIGRITHSAGAFWTFLNWRSLPVVMRALSDAGMPFTSCLVWDKQRIGPGGMQGLRPRYEMVALSAGPQFAIPDRGCPDVWEHKVGQHKEHGHPAEKPWELVRRIIGVSAVQPDGVVLDPFMGSGTTLVAAKQLGLRAVGIEAEERYCEIAARRLSQGVLDFGVAS